jgi:hypothetical protein
MYQIKRADINGVCIVFNNVKKAFASGAISLSHMSITYGEALW